MKTKAQRYFFFNVPKVDYCAIRIIGVLGSSEKNLLQQF